MLLRWAEIVGEGLKDLCAPVKVTYPRDQGLAATLVVRTTGARAPEVAHLEPRIVERVNQFYGYRAIGRIKLTQTTAPRRRPARRRPARPRGRGVFQLHHPASPSRLRHSMAKPSQPNPPLRRK